MRNTTSSLSLLTDLYQLTMAYGYWKSEMHHHESVFHLFFRKHPFKGGFTLACGLAPVIEFLKQFNFNEKDIAFLSTLTGNDGQPLFEPDFLSYLQEMEFTCTVHAVSEGTVVFPHEPLLRIQGPLIQCQLLETVLLNILNFQTLIATKSARICRAAEGEPVLEFGLRRAQGIDGGISASRAAYIGGCAATSNVLAGAMYDIPVKGTHAHSWVMAFGEEEKAFKAYAEAMPNNCVFLVDTYDTIEGVKQAIEQGKELREQGHEMVGIRLDSGDLAALSIEARKLLDEADFPDASIVASNDLDEYRIKKLKEAGAKINVWGVGTRLSTAYDQPALGGVYKLAALRPPEKEWEYTVKLSEQVIKVSNPGILQVRRYKEGSRPIGDMIFHELTSTPCGDYETFTGIPVDAEEKDYEDLLQLVCEDGNFISLPRNIHEVRQYAKDQMAQFDSDCLAIENPAEYLVGLERELANMKADLIREHQNDKSV